MKWRKKRQNKKKTISMVASITDSFIVPPKMVLYNKNTPIVLVADDPNMNFKNFPEKVFLLRF